MRSSSIEHIFQFWLCRTHQLFEVCVILIMFMLVPNGPSHIDILEDSYSVCTEKVNSYPQSSYSSHSISVFAVAYHEIVIKKNKKTP